MLVGHYHYSDYD